MSTATTTAATITAANKLTTETTRVCLLRTKVSVTETVHHGGSEVRERVHMPLLVSFLQLYSVGTF